MNDTRFAENLFGVIPQGGCVLLFTRIPNTTLYRGAPQDSSSGHQGEVLLILPAQTPVPPGSMTLDEAWEFQHPTYGAGYLLFVGPESGFPALNDTQAAAFANRVHELLPRVVNNHHLSLAWVTGEANNPSSLRLQTISIVRAGEIFRTQNLPQVIRFQQIEIMFLPGVPVTLGNNGLVFENTEYLAPPGADPSIELPTRFRVYMRSAAPRDIDKVGETIEVPLTGANRGSLSFDLDELIADEIDAGVIDTAIYYVAPDQERGRDQSLRYPLFNLADNMTGDDTVSFRAVLFAAHQMNSRFEFVRDGSPRLRSNFGTYDGHPIYFIPSDGSALVFAHVPNPGVHPSRAAEVKTHYALVPTGYFELAVDPEGDTDGMVWLRGGASGNEFISFQPRRNGTPGDIMAFFPGQNGYGPDRVDLSRRVEQTLAAVSGELLTEEYLTSWVAVSPHPNSPNGHTNQYYAQPDDNVLHEIVSATNKFLQSVEMPVSDLQPLDGNGSDVQSSFPLAPLNGVIAPDPMVAAEFEMSKYVVFETEIMSPTRKNRITANAPGLTATSNRRTLLETPKPMSTPQGMIVEAVGNDWQKMTLAYDGTNHLRFDDVSGQFQVAMNTNPLFMVVSKAGEIEESVSVSPENLIEITGWPFRLEVGEMPLGTTDATATGLHRYNNVVIFKFKQGKFEDLVADSAQWASPGVFNEDLADVQEWLGEIIEDAKEKAEEDATSDLYSSLVADVLTDPDWFGVLAFNVTVPLAEMPCEVQGLLGGMRNFSSFKAHHVGFPVAMVSQPNGVLKMEKSSIFGLIDYEDDEELPVLDPKPKYEYYTSTLKVRFANTEIADFSSTATLIMREAFGEPILPELMDQNIQRIDSLELEGSYQTFNGTPSYTFELVAENDPMVFNKEANSGIKILKEMVITKVQFKTAACVDPATMTPTSKVKAEFRFWGSLAFLGEAAIDFVSFDKLPFSEMMLAMEFGFLNGLPQNPTADDFLFDPGNLRFELSGSSPREDSLFSHLPLRLTNFHYATRKLDITQLGYWHIPNMVPGWGEAIDPQFALAITLDIGPLTSALKAKKRVNIAIELIAAWAPSSRGGGTTFGLKLGQNSEGTREFNIEGVFAIGVDNFGFMQLPLPGGGHLNTFFIKSAYISLMKKQFPPGGTFSILFFLPHRPNESPDGKAIGAYASYKADGGGGGGIGHDPQFGIQVSIDNAPTGAKVDQEVTITVKVEYSGSIETPFSTVPVKVSMEAESEEYLAKKPTPSYHSVEISHGVEREAYVDFKWKAHMPADYTLTAKIEVVGVLNVDDLVATHNIKIQYSEAKKEKATKLNIEFLGVGWRVGMPEGNLQLLGVNTIEDVFELLEEQIIPDKSTDALAAHLGQVYSPDHGLTFGIDMTIMEVFRFAFLWAQPNNLYGGLIGFTEKAHPKLKGFQFQILYKKLTDDLGVLQMQLKLPDFMRQFELGAASITIPVIGIDIFTNGDFKLDFGFPHKMDFSRSFSVQMMAGPIPIIGFVGFYLNKLSGATSTTVPTFADPDAGPVKWNQVWEFGLGFKIGAGKTIEKGPLRAGFTIAVVVVLEGSFAWVAWKPNGTGSGEFNYASLNNPDLTGPPATTQGGPADWYRIKGQAGLTAHLYGILDFGIVKIGVEVEASAMFSFVYETYKDTQLGVMLSVSVRVSIVIGSFKIFGKTVKISISFSFSATFNFKFTIKNTTPPPNWNSFLVAADQFKAPTANRILQDHHLTPIVWTSMLVESQISTLQLTFAPQVTVAPYEGDQRAHVVAGLTISAGSSGLFRGLTRKLFIWAVLLHTGEDDIDEVSLTFADLEDLNERLSIPRTLATAHGTEAVPLNYAAIKDFLKQNYDNLSIMAVEIDEDDPAPVPAIVFPMVPELRMQTTGQQGSEIDFDFGHDNRPGAGYEQDLAKYFDDLLVDVEYKSGILPNSNRMLEDADPANPTMATLVFQDYFAFLVKASVDRALEWAQPKHEAANPDTVWQTSLSDLLGDADFISQLDVVGQMANRTFFNGLRIPRNFTDSSLQLVPLYELTGQQFPLRLEDLVPYKPATTEPATPAEAAFLPEWSLQLSLRTGADDDLMDDLIDVTMEIPGITGVGTNDPVLDENRLNINAMNSVEPSVAITSQPTRIPPVTSRPLWYTFANPTHIDRIIPTANPRANDPIQTFQRRATTYPLPQSLRERLASDGVPAARLLKNGLNTSLESPTHFKWALRIDFSAKKVERPVDATPPSTEDPAPQETMEFVANTYMFGGTNEVTRDLIGKLLDLAGSPAGNANALNGVTGMRLSFELDGKVDGLAGHAMANTSAHAGNLGPDVVLMKTNLSTVSAPQTGLQQVAHPDPDDYSAAMTTDQVRRFLRLIWEASIVNAPGYYLYYDTSEGGIPEDAFQGRSNSAPMSLFVTFDDLYPWCNTLLLENTALPLETAYTFAEDNLRLETNEPTWMPSIAPGAIAFELTRQNPEAVAPQSMATELGSMFNLLSYYIDGTGNTFTSSMRGLPVGPSSTNPDDPTLEPPHGAPWVYRQGIRIFPFAEGAPTIQPNTYLGTGNPVTIRFEFLDIFGNLYAGTPPNALTATVLYTDTIVGINQWPGVASGFQVNPDSGNITVTLSFAADSYPVNASHSEASLEIFHQVREQLNGPGVFAELSSTLAPDLAPVDVKSQLVAFVDDVIAHIDGTDRVTEATITRNLSITGITALERGKVTSHSFEVDVALAIRRNPDLVEPIPESTEKLPDALRSITSVPPEPVTGIVDSPPPTETYDDGQELALAKFAREFEAAYPELKVATGFGRNGPATIWAVRLQLGGSGAPGMFAARGGDASFFAPAPLSTTLENRDDIPMTLGGVVTAVSVTNIDMDVLGREFLAEVDNVLGPAIAPTARKINSAAYLNLVKAKETLAGGIIKGVTNVLEADSGTDSALKEAREIYKQRLLVKLSSAYDVESAVVFPMSTANSGALARLYGGAREKVASADDFSFSAAKVDLAPGTRNLAFLVDANRATAQASIHVDLEYAVSHVEHDIDQPSNGYEASSWLNFVIQNKTVNLGEVDIPIPLREYPTPPALIDQESIPVDIDNATTVQAATLWEYRYTFHQAVVAQDSVFANVQFNVGPDGIRDLQDVPEDLLTCLARFHYEFPEIKSEINSLARGNKVITNDTERNTLSAALSRFATLASDVAREWGLWVETPLGRRLDELALEPYEWDFEYIERPDDGNNFIVEAAKRYVTPGFAHSLPWLEVLQKNEDGHFVAVTPERDVVNADVVRFRYEWAGQVNEERTRTLYWRNLDVLHTENAWGGIRLSRNLNLSRIGSTTRPVNPRFIYETQQVRFVNKVTPLIDNKRPIDITGGSDEKKGLNQHLSSLLRDLFGPALGQTNPHPRLIKMGVRYAYDVRGQGGDAVGPAQNPDDLGFYEFQAFLPVTQVLPFNLLPTVTDLDEFAGDLANRMTSWLNAVNPSRARAFYEFDLAIFAALSATDLPVLRLRRLWLDLDKIG